MPQIAIRALAPIHSHSFSFDSHSVRVVVRDGEPWFVAADVCAAIAIGNPTMALRALDADEKALSSIEGLSRGNDQANIISESGMYTLVLRCRDAVKAGTAPHRFRKWVTAEVLPAIRKTGAYAPTTTNADRYATAAQMARSLLDLLRSFDMPEEKTHAIAIEHIRRETGVELASAFATIQHQLALTPERRALLEREARRIVEMIPQDSMGSAHQLLSEITKAQRGSAALPAIA
ncbi:BRO family protein [Paraburkholderia tropica]|uniref:BRO-N domain-containing protein n=1 Tax=Paraburkholderia tropica TaxID=92647 RepID=UPI0032B5B76E